MSGQIPSAPTRGQAESIGVVLLLGVVIVSVSTFGVFSLTDWFDAGTGGSGGSVNVVVDVSYQTLELTHGGGRSLPMEDVRVFVRNASGTTEHAVSPARMTQGDGDGTFEAGERWRLDWDSAVGEERRVSVVDAGRNRVLFTETYTVSPTQTPRPENPARGETPTAAREADVAPPSLVARGGSTGPETRSVVGGWLSREVRQLT